MKRTPKTFRSRKALFLDRDGVINVDHGYVHRAQDCDFVPGIFELAKAAMRLGYRIIIVTNQSGIARGYYSRDQFHAFSCWLEQQFWRRGILISHTYHCPHHPAQTGPFGFSCSCRKPRPGMLFKARKDFGIRLDRSIMVGDSLSDIRCAQVAGIGKAVLLRQSRRHFEPKLEARIKKPYYRASSLRAIKSLLLSGSHS